LASNIEVYKEVMGDYPVFVNPDDPFLIGEGFNDTLNKKKSRMLRSYTWDQTANNFMLQIGLK
jgi:hypothetical protein